MESSELTSNSDQGYTNVFGTQAQGKIGKQTGFSDLNEAIID